MVSKDKRTLLAIIPARAGSKGVTGKNKSNVGGVPLIEYTVRSVQASRCVGLTVLTTDDVEILSRYRSRSGVFVVERPAALANDDSRVTDAVAHALVSCRAAGLNVPEALLLAQPTSPLRNALDIDGAYDLFLRCGRKPVISACKVEGMRHPRDMYRLRQDSRGELFIPAGEAHTNRQGYECLYQRNGAIYIVSTEFFLRSGCLTNQSPFIFEMPWERSINIDCPGDLLIARALIESGLIKTDL